MWGVHMRPGVYRSPKIAVRQNLIGGRGLFAAATLAAGDIVRVKEGHLLDKAGPASHERTVDEADVQVADGLFLAPVDEPEFEGVMVFMIHSCEPNFGTQGQIIFVALRDFAAGNELTLDYGTIDRDVEPMVCRRGARGIAESSSGRTGRSPTSRRSTGPTSLGICRRKSHL